MTGETIFCWIILDPAQSCILLNGRGGVLVLTSSRKSLLPVDILQGLCKLEVFNRM